MTIVYAGRTDREIGKKKKLYRHGGHAQKGKKASGMPAVMWDQAASLRTPRA
jgi:hypothetical protein